MSSIAIIEDDATLCDFYFEALRDHAEEIHVFNSSTKALLGIPQISPDVIILDMEVPGVSAATILALIRRYHQLRHTGVIVVTGRTLALESARKYWDADHVFALPINPTDLHDAVEDLIVKAS